MTTLRSRASALALALALSAPTLAGQNPGIVVSTDWLAQHLKDPAVVVLQIEVSGMRMGPGYAEGHIPGARRLDYDGLATEVDGIELELPTVDAIRAVFEPLGISNASHVVLTGPPLMVTRAWYTLHYLGLADVSALDGGVTKWKSEGRPLETAKPAVTPGKIVANPQPQIVARTQYVFDHIGKKGVSFIDTRSPGEYDGSGERHGMPSTGHIEGARYLNWHELFASDSDFTLADHAKLVQLYRERVVPGDTVVTYCYIGYRASGSYFVALLLGYPARIYDGSYDEWAKKHMPTVTAPTALLTP